MNYYQPRELQRDGQPTGEWHYTCKNDDRVWPVGYCGQAWTIEKDRTHVHASAEAARACFVRYLAYEVLDFRFVGRLPDERVLPCEICKRPTPFVVEIRGGYMISHILCSSHQTRGAVHFALRDLGDMITS